jgi:hypothetical protein
MLLTETVPLQLILPTDKRNPSFSLYLTADEQAIHVFYGLELLEVVPADREHIAYRMLVARLYNAGLRVRTLAEVFSLDPKTMRAWGQALCSRDPALLQRMVLGPEAGRKRTAAIDGYVRQRWPQLLDEGCRNYREKLQQEIEAIFDTRLSGETLRVLMAQINTEGAPTPDATAPVEAPDAPEPRTESPTPPSSPSPTSAVVVAAAAADVAIVTTDVGSRSAALTSALAVAREKATEATAADEVVRSTALRETPCSDHAERAAPGGALATPPLPASSKPTPCFWTPAPGTAILCDHAGLLLFAHALGSLPAAVAPREPLLAQWLGSVLLGAANVEQTKYLNWDDLGLLLGSVVRFPTTQREQLQRLATPATVEAVLRWNLRQLGPAAEGTDFYFDPHTQHYTGMQAVLKGWCAAIRWADKLVNSDYVHTTQGHPIYFECTDNYDDLRARFAPLIARLRTTLQWPQRVLTFVVDRGIYSHDVFAQVIADPAVHLITWQKGYVAGPWDAAAVSGTFGLEKVRNHAQDVRLYQFSYHDGKWAANPALRQIVVRATNPAGETTQLALLTDDLTRPAEPIVRLMFNRWIQENDFKYLNAHFGLNQLTSYRSLPYATLRAELTDRLVPSHAYVQKAKAGQALLKQKARLLLTADQAQRTEDQRQQRLAELQKPSPHPHPETRVGAVTAADASAAARRQELTKLKHASQRFEKYRAERALKLDALHQKIITNQTEKAALQREVSRIDQLVAEGMVRLDTGNKTLMDAIKLTARNLFYLALAPFKAAYNNYRDDHDYFRQLSQSAGVLRWTETEIEVHLVPTVNYAPKLRKIIDRVLQELNASDLTLPDGSNRKLRLRLTRKEQIEVRLRDLDES